MIRELAFAALLVGLAGCTGQSESSDSGDQNGPEAAEVELFANGLPRYTNFDEASLETELTAVNTNQVEFETSDSIDEVFDFYYAAMEREGLSPSSTAIVGEPSSGQRGISDGANVTAQSRSAGTEVSVLIFDGSSNADRASNFTDGVPRYPGLADSDVTTEKAGDGRRDVMRFVTQDSPAAVLSFYRDAFGNQDMLITSLQTRMEADTSTEYGSIYIREQLGGDGTSVTLQTRGDRWETTPQEL